MAPSDIANNGSATILRTIDGGRSWRVVYVHDGGRGFAWKLWPVAGGVVFAALQSQDGVYRVAKSVNGGETWETLVVAVGRPYGFGVQGIGFLNARIGWVGGFFRGLYGTTDGGKKWFPEALPDSVINRFELVGASLITAGSRGVLRYGAN